ncbi:dethiobiotin synthase [Thalassotalea mangrovi]|uniref:ATP-dependent dethiobiotin synthetase BioD n=1 Tax=Thalassotalea mangrovi TaxID=2572245 RepID=A0A4U1B496_9GAMM|nr:dethiobiotin synthase [Thalassotalea mangrovi]TKB44886.1 dethiobiotin synthase [Thalassotalea mangrovi]
MKVKSIFVTATDTDAGKTYVSEQLIKGLVNNGNKVAAFKPISAGCTWRHGVLQNEDALRLKTVANSEQTLSEINPIAFEPAIAPHIAAAEQGQVLSVAELSREYQKVKKRNVDICLIEGAGGWCLPLNDKEYFSDFVRLESIPVILVVGMKLGCLNHAILTYETLLNDGVEVIGWIANQSQSVKMQNHDENLAYLKQAIKAPCLAEIGYGEDDSCLAQSTLTELVPMKHLCEATTNCL